MPWRANNGPLGWQIVRYNEYGLLEDTPYQGRGMGNMYPGDRNTCDPYNEYELIGIR
jgi:hypothetical protein